ncbi:MAG: glycerol kinase GlpK [Clostridia bacterium]|nr:glycerol kinase GlpK [Clostridia bacterium]
MREYLIALDEGTTSARSIIFDKKANIVAVSQKEFTQIYPRASWVEQDPMEIYASQYATLTEVIAKSGISPSEIAGIGITNQRETTIVWNKSTGEVIYNAIVWQCRRTADICNKLKADGYEQLIKDKTGLVLDAYFSATKITWILDNVAGARELAECGELLFGTVDTWLMWKLSGGEIFATDRTNASRTMLYNIHTGEWDEELLGLFKIPRSMLPEVRSSSEIYGHIDLFGERIAIGGVAGDQQAALFGQGCFNAGETKVTYGTGCFLLSHTGQTPKKSRYNLISTVCATQKDAPAEYALEGSVFVGGAVIQWLRDELKLIESSAESEICAQRVPDTQGVYVLPAFSGMGAPHWNMGARGMICGITRGTNRDHIIRAALESIAYQTEDVLYAMRGDLETDKLDIKADGGASANSLLMQFQSDISNTAITLPVCKEATALGAALLCGLSVGVYENRDEIKALLTPERVYIPSMDEQTRTEKLDGWKRTIGACKCF